MGNRANILVKNDADDGGVYLYSHWDGLGVCEALQRALRRQKRWDDTPYLTRMIFCEMVKDDLGGETGFGISTRISDNENPIVVVEVRGARVGLAAPGKPPARWWSFDEYIALENVGSVAREASKHLGG